MWRGARLGDDGVFGKESSNLYTLKQSSLVIIIYQVRCMDI